jgi:hypothetical protein
MSLLRDKTYVRSSVARISITAYYGRAGRHGESLADLKAAMERTQTAGCTTMICIAAHAF